MVTNTIFLSYWNGFACNQVGYKWLHWLQAKSRYNIRAKQGRFVVFATLSLFTHGINI